MEQATHKILLKAAEIHKAGKFKEAERLYKSILVADPGHAEANYNLGILVARRGDIKSSLPFFRVAIQTNHNVDKFWRSYIDASFKLGLAQEIKTILDQDKISGVTAEIVEHAKTKLAELNLNKINPQKTTEYRAENITRIKKRMLDKKERKLASKIKSPYDLSKNNLVPQLAQLQNFIQLYNNRYFSEAESLAKLLTQNFPAHPFGYKALGSVYFETNRMNDAVIANSRAVKLSPRDPEALNNLGNTLAAIGRFSEAETMYMQAIKLKSDYAVAHSNLGNLLSGLGRLSEAVAQYKEAIKIQPDYAEAYSNLGNALTDLSCFSEAETQYKQALKIKPDYAEAYSNHGNALKNLGRFSEAEISCKAAIGIKPNYAEAYNNLGIAVKEQGRIIEAIENYKEAIRLKPDCAEFYNNLGNAFFELDRFSQAELSCREAIKLKPDYSEAYSNLGNAVKDLGRLCEAERYYRKAVSLKPNCPWVYSNFLLNLNYIKALPIQEMLREATKYGTLVSQNANSKYSSWNYIRRPEKLKIGFVSGDFRQHPVGYFIEGLLQNIDRNRFDIVAYSVNTHSDELTSIIKSYCNDWRSIIGRPDTEIAQLIYQDSLHILIDLSGHTDKNRLPVFSYKPAPIQMSYLGYFATTGLPEIDYIIGDPYVTPENEEFHFTEKVLRLPQTYICFTPPKEQIDIFDLPAHKNRYVTFGCFNNLSKISADVINLWSKILTRLPSSKLFLKTKQLSDKHVVNSVIKQFLDQNISSSRLILEGASPRVDLLSSYNRVDIALDPFPYPGGTTSAEALWMGVPIITLKGDRFLSHVGETIGHNSGQSEWIACSQEEYIEKAVRFALNLDFLENIRRSLRQKVLTSPLFDTVEFSKKFEKLMWEAWTNFENNTSNI